MNLHFLSLFFIIAETAIGYTYSLKVSHLQKQINYNYCCRYPTSLNLNFEVDGLLVDGKWYNKSFSKEDLDNWWNSLQKPLLTIGIKGVANSQINSLKELVTSHDKVRVKLASDKLDTYAIALEILNSELISNSLTVLQVRNREIMFGSKL